MQHRFDYERTVSAHVDVRMAKNRSQCMSSWTAALQRLSRKVLHFSSEQPSPLRLVESQHRCYVPRCL